MDRTIKPWDQTPKEQQEKFDQERTDTLAKQQALFDTAFEAFKRSAGSANKDIHEKQETIRKLHDLVTDETVTGGYHKSAKDEGKAANFWRFTSIGCLMITVTVWSDRSDAVQALCVTLLEQRNAMA